MATVSRRLPQRPHLDIPKREARELLNAWRAAQSRTGTLTMILVGKRARLATTIQEEGVFSLSSPTGGEGRGEEADEYPSPLTLSPLVPRGAREKISRGSIMMRLSKNKRAKLYSLKALQPIISIKSL